MSAGSAAPLPGAAACIGGELGALGNAPSRGGGSDCSSGGGVVGVAPLRATLPLYFLPLVALGGLVMVGSVLLALRWSIARDAELAGVTLALSSASWAGLRGSAVALRAIAARHRGLFIAALSAAYLFKQAFATPGSVLLNVLAGVALGSAVGVPLVCALSATGAACGYLLSREFGGGALLRCGCERRLGALRSRVDAARGRGRRGGVALMLTLMSLRLFPGTPHWAINIAAPHAGVPLGVFWASAALGMMPYNALTVRGGELIATTDWADVSSPRQLGALAAGALAFAALAAAAARAGAPEAGARRGHAQSGGDAAALGAGGAGGSSGSDALAVEEAGGLGEESHGAGRARRREM